MYLSPVVYVWNANIEQKSIFHYTDNKYRLAKENAQSSQPFTLLSASLQDRNQKNIHFYSLKFIYQ